MMGERVLRCGVAALLSVAIIACTADRERVSMEAQKFDQLRADPLFTGLHVPGRTAGDVLGNPGGGYGEASAKAFRRWSQPPLPPEAFASVVTDAIGLGLRLRHLLCGTQLSAMGVKAVGEWTADVSIIVPFTGEDGLVVDMTIHGGNKPQGPPPVEPVTVSDDCPQSIRDLATLG